MWKFKLLYHLQTTLQNIREHKSSLLMSLTAVAFTLLLLSGYILFLSNLESVQDRLGEHLQITMYLDKSVSSKDRAGMEKQVLGKEEVDSVKYCSPDQAMEGLRSVLGEAADVLEDLHQNPLPPSLEVRLKKRFRDLETIRALSVQLGALEGVTEVEYGGHWIERFFAFVRIMKWMGLSLGLLLFVATVIVISSTLTLGFYARKDEIEILRLVGATESYVRFPFFLEAMLQGTGGALVAVVLLWVFYQLFRINLEGSWNLFAGWVQFHFLSPIAVFFLLFLGAFVGILSCLVCFMRFSSGEE